MPSYLILQFSGVLQSWGGVNLQEPKKVSPRTTLTFPTKSAVLGIIRSSLGLGRDDESPVLVGVADDIVIREDRRGWLSRDYQVSQLEHHGIKVEKNGKEIPKDCIADGSYLVAANVGEDNVDDIVRALNDPLWAPFLGRRAHVPSTPLLVAVVAVDDIVSTLQRAPLVVDGGGDERNVRFISSERRSGWSPVTVTDVPDSFDTSRRLYGSRTVFEGSLPVQTVFPDGRNPMSTPLQHANVLKAFFEEENNHD